MNSKTTYVMFVSFDENIYLMKTINLPTSSKLHFYFFDFIKKEQKIKKNNKIQMNLFSCSAKRVL